MAIIITDKFQLRQKNFLDDRQGIASSVSALKSWNYSSVPIPEGFEVYVDGVWYTYRSSNPDDPVTGRFKTRTDDEGVDDLKVRVTRLEFEDGRDVAQTFAQIKTEAFWKDSTGVSHARAGRIVTVTSDGDNNGPWYLISSDYTKTENWIKLIGRGDLVTTTGGAAVSDTSVYTSAKTDAIFPKKVSTENITAKWIFKENQVFEKDLTTNTLHATTGTITNLNSTSGNISDLTSETANIETGTITNLNSISGTVTNLNSTTSNISDLTSGIANIETGTVTNLNSTTGNISNLTSETANIETGTITNLNSTTSNISNLTSGIANIETGTITNLNSISGTVTNLSSTTSNIETGTVTNLNSTTGNISDLTSETANIGTGTITNLNSTNSNATNQTVTGKLTSTGETVLEEAKIGTNGSIKDEDGKTVARINKIVADESEIEDLDQHIRDQMGLIGVIGVGNLLRNTSFSGQFESKEMNSDTVLRSETVVYNSRIDDWEVTPDWEIVADSDSVTGYSMKLMNSTSMISQETSLSLNAGVSYILSWKQKGDISVEIQGYDLEIQEVSQNSRYKLCYTKIVPTSNKKETIYFKGGPGNVFEIKFEGGLIPTSWSPSYTDTDPVAARTDSYEFLKSSLLEHSEPNSTVISGLFLKDQIKVGEVINDEVREVWGGLSGVYNDKNDIMLWSGGTYGDALDLISKIENNPEYLDKLPESTLRGLTKAIITFGYKTIFTDLYAVGKFKGKHLDSDGGEIISFNTVTGLFPGVYSTAYHTYTEVSFTTGRLDKIDGIYPDRVNFGGTTIDFSNGFCKIPDKHYRVDVSEAGLPGGITHLYLIFHKGYLVRVSSVEDYNEYCYWY